MAAGLSAGSDDSIAKTTFGFVSGFYAVPTICALSLHSAAIGTAKVIASEWTNGGAGNTHYTTRLTAGVDTANWLVAAFSAGTGSVVTNKIQLAFPAATGTGTNLVAVGLNDSATIGAGLMRLFSDVSSVSITAGIIVQFNVGDISFTFF